VSLDVSQGGGGDPVDARRLFGRKANGMGGRQTLRCLAGAHCENRVRSGLDYSLNGSKRDSRRWRAHPTSVDAAVGFLDSEVELIAMEGGHERGDAVVTVHCRYVL